MKQTFLGAPPDEIKKRIKKHIAVCIAAALVTRSLNIAFAYLRTPDNHTVFLIVNIASDLIVGWGCVYLLDSFAVPNRRLLKLYESRGTKMTGTVISVSENTERYSGFDCRTVSFGQYKLFLIDNGNIKLTPGSEVSLAVVHGIVKEVVS